MPSLEEERNPELDDFRRRFWWALPLTLVVFAIAMSGGAFDRLLGQMRPWVELVLATPVVLWAGWPFFQRWTQPIATRQPNMWTLIGTGTGVAWLYSVVAPGGWWRWSTTGWFDSVSSGSDRTGYRLGPALLLLFVGTGAGGVSGQATDSPPSAAAESATMAAHRDGLERVAAIGRIEPGEGVIRVAGPPRPVVVVAELLVREGDRVTRSQPLAVLAGTSVQRAAVTRLEAELANAERELERNRELFRKNTLSESGLRAYELDRDVAAARLAGARAELALSTVTSPIDGQVLEIHARESERVGPEGILELGDTRVMYAVAEVYETDIGRVRVGQPAKVTSPALIGPLAGTVERIGLKIGKRDVLSTDPVADADSRVVEVKVRLERPELAAALTNLRVDVVIGAEP